MAEFKSYNMLYCKFIENNPNIKEVSFKDFKYSVQHYSYYELAEVFIPRIPVKTSETVTFKMIIDLYLLHRDLKDMILKYILRFESLFKETLGHELGAQYGNDSQKIFIRENLVDSNDNYKDKEIRFYIKLLHRESRKPTSLYRKKGTVPPWIFTRNLSMSQLNTLFHITKGQNNVISQILYSINDTGFIDETSKLFFSYATELILQYRNKLAHGANIIDFPTIDSYVIDYNTYQLFVKSEYSQKEFKNERLEHGTFRMFIICISILLPKQERVALINDLALFIDTIIKNRSVNTGMKYLSFFSLTTEFVDKIKNIPGIMDLP